MWSQQLDKANPRTKHADRVLVDIISPVRLSYSAKSAAI
jgi:hypothetical protein